LARPTIKEQKKMVSEEEYEQIAEVIYEHNFKSNYSDAPKDGTLIR
jgi:hypothetical protein